MKNFQCCFDNDRDKSGELGMDPIYGCCCLQSIYVVRCRVISLVQGMPLIMHGPTISLNDVGRGISSETGAISIGVTINCSARKRTGDLEPVRSY